jgi:hypothetical protein
MCSECDWKDTCSVLLDDLYKAGRRVVQLSPHVNREKLVLVYNPNGETECSVKSFCKADAKCLWLDYFVRVLGIAPLLL